MKTRCLLFPFLFIVMACNQNKPSAVDNSSIPSETKPPIDTSIHKEIIEYTSYVPVDVSPMDMSYFPTNYPQLRSKELAVKKPYARVIYSRPHLGGRELFGNVLKYNQPWRLGANESTEIEFFTEATILGRNVDDDRYVLYCIPTEEEWTFILNTHIDSWGLTPDRTKDLMQFTVPVKKLPFSLEYLSIVFEGQGKTAEMVVSWGKYEARLPILFH